MKQSFFKCLTICFAIFLVITGMSVFSSRVHIGFFGYVAMLVFGTLFTGTGAFLGDMFRHFTRPDLIWSSSSFETLKAKIFWLVGPQVIGWIIGFIGFQGMMRNVLGYYI
ncbi:hypothetical protein [Chitinimonas sp. JJ19]|uniref:hypothetical protein n=1 Tax=Chitinimonas sp. JJ19 TaxID=3109352 RepID=UPI00300340FB